MTKIELLFMEDANRTKPISFEEFSEAGWNIKEYFHYIQLCENFRATCICVSSVKPFLMFNDTKTKSIDRPTVDTYLPFFSILCLAEWLVSFFSSSSRLSEWVSAVGSLEPVSNELLASFIPCLHNMTYRRANGAANLMECNCDSDLVELEKECASLIYWSADDFRMEIENHIKEYLLSPKMSAAQQYYYRTGNLIEQELSNISTNELEWNIAVYEKMQEDCKEPEFPLDVNSYSSLQAWAAKYNHMREVVEDYPEHINLLKKELEKRFVLKCNTLYVYKGYSGCVGKHTVSAVTAITYDLKDNEVLLNVNYCEECNQFFIGYNEYARYLEIYKFLAVRFEIVQDENDKMFFDREETALLARCGYSVAEKNQLSQSQREAVLVGVIKHQIMTKPEVMKHLELLINTNGSRKFLENAKRKWSSDLAFVRYYNFSNQQKVLIDEIKSKSYRLIRL